MTVGIPGAKQDIVVRLNYKLYHSCRPYLCVRTASTAEVKNKWSSIFILAKCFSGVYRETLPLYFTSTDNP